LHCNVFLYQRLASCSMGGTLVGILITDGLDPEWRYTSSISLCDCSCANCLWDRKYPSLIPVSYDPCQIYTGQRHWRHFSGHRGALQELLRWPLIWKAVSQPYTLSSFCPRKAPGESYYVKPITSCSVLWHTVAMLAGTKANRQPYLPSLLPHSGTGVMGTCRKPTILTSREPLHLKPPSTWRRFLLKKKQMHLPKMM